MITFNKVDHIYLQYTLKGKILFVTIYLRVQKLYDFDHMSPLVENNLAESKIYKFVGSISKDQQDPYRGCIG